MAIAPLITVPVVYAQDTAQKETAPAETESVSNEGKRGCIRQTGCNSV